MATSTLEEDNSRHSLMEYNIHIKTFFLLKLNLYLNLRDILQGSNYIKKPFVFFFPKKVGE